MTGYSATRGSGVRTLALGCLVATVSLLLGWTLAKRFQQDAPQVTPDTRQAANEPARSSMPPAAFPANRGKSIPVDAGALDPARGQLRLSNAPVNNAAQNRKDRERMAAELELGHRAEPVDAKWAGRAEPALDELAASPELAAAGLRPAGLATDCRAVTCRISATFDSAVDAEQWGILLATGTGKTFRQTKSVVLPAGSGGYELRMYGVRR